MPMLTTSQQLSRWMGREPVPLDARVHSNESNIMLFKAPSPCRSDSCAAPVGVQFPTEAKGVSFALSVPKWSTPSKVCHLHVQRPLVWHALHVFTNTLPARNRDLECEVTERMNSPASVSLAALLAVSEIGNPCPPVAGGASDDR